MTKTIAAAEELAGHLKGKGFLPSEKLILERRNVYGRELIYPACETSRNLVKLTGRVTFGEDDLEVLRLLGFELVINAGV